MRRRFYNNIASNCADPSRADYFPQWCDDFQALCKRFRNATEAAREAIREEGTTFLGAPMDVPCQTWNGALPLEPRRSAERAWRLKRAICYLPRVHQKQREHVAMTGWQECSQIGDNAGCCSQRTEPPGAPAATGTARTSTTYRIGEHNFPSTSQPHLRRHAAGGPAARAGALSWTLPRLTSFVLAPQL